MPKIDVEAALIGVTGRSVSNPEGRCEEGVAAKIPVQWKRDEMPKCTNIFARDMRRYAVIWGFVDQDTAHD